MTTPAGKFAVDLGWPVVLRDIGVEPQDLLRHAGLPRDLFAHKNATLSIDEYCRLWESLRQLTGDPALPLRLGQAVSAEAFSPPLFAAFCSPNLSVALKRLSQYKPLVGPLRLDLTATARGVTACYRGIAGHPLPPSMGAAELVFLVHMARMATRERIVPTRIELTHELEDVAAYAAFFGRTPVKGASNMLGFSAEDAARPFLTVNEGMFSIFEPALRKRLAEIDAAAAFRDRVRAALVEALPSGQFAMADIARMLAVSTRTLQRRLAKEGTSFQSELNAVREELARSYLTRTSHSSAEISFLLGYDDPNSFIRAFHLWTGQTPRAARGARAH